MYLMCCLQQNMGQNLWSAFPVDNIIGVQFHPEKVMSLELISLSALEQCNVNWSSNRSFAYL